MMLGVVLHTMAIYTVDSSWKISSATSTTYADPILNFIHLFRMPAFFIIAGYFTALVIGKDGEREYSSSRMVRLGVPLLFAGLLFNLPLVGVINNGPESMGWDTYILSGSWLGHLWFLGTLIIYSLLIAAVWKWVKPWLAKDFKYTWLVWLCVLTIAYPITLRISWYLEASGLQLIFFTMSNLFQYFPFFVFGIVFHFQFHRLNQFGGISIWATLSLFLYLLWSIVSFEPLKDMILFLMATSFSFFLFTIFERVFNGKARWKKELANSSYTIYLVHQPIIILLGLVVVNSSLNVHVQVSLIMISTALIAFVIHFLFVKNIPYLAFLMNGRPLSEGKQQ